MEKQRTLLLLGVPGTALLLAALWPSSGHSPDAPHHRVVAQTPAAAAPVLGNPAVAAAERSPAPATPVVAELPKAASPAVADAPPVPVDVANLPEVPAFSGQALLPFVISLADSPTADAAESNSASQPPTPASEESADELASASSASSALVARNDLPPGAFGHVVLALAGNKVLMAGEVPTQRTRQRLEQKAAAVYPGRQIVAHLQVSAALQKAAEGVDLTLLSFPSAPSEDSPGILASARLGQPWRHLRIPIDGLSGESLASLPIFPEDPDFIRAAASCAGILADIKAHLDGLSLPKTAQH